MGTIIFVGAVEQLVRCKALNSLIIVAERRPRVAPVDSPESFSMTNSTHPVDPNASSNGPHHLAYNGVAMAFHWLLALMIVVSFSVGLFMSDLPFSPLRLKLYNWHKWAGVTILALSALRLLWRLTHRAPADVAMPAWQRIAAHVTHGLLYLLFFMVPLSGWAYSSASGFPIVWFGVLPLPDFVAPDKLLAATLRDRHELLAWCLAGLVSLHVAGALKHQLIDRDGLMGRMWPRRRRAAGLV